MSIAGLWNNLIELTEVTNVHEAVNCRTTEFPCESSIYSNCNPKVFETTDNTEFHRYFFDNHKFSLKIFILNI